MRSNNQSVSKNARMPVLFYQTGGYQVIGHATSVEGARRIFLRTMDDSSRSLISNHGFTLSVGLRSDLQVELNGGPHGYIHGIHKTISH